MSPLSGKNKMAKEPGEIIPKTGGLKLAKTTETNPRAKVPGKQVGEKQKPIPKIVEVAAKAMKKPETVTNAEIKSMAARILDDERNAPRPHKPKAGKPSSTG